jgi:plasmid stability protein
MLSYGDFIDGRCLMSSILVRGLKAQTVRRLKDRARRNGRSLQNEAKLLIEQSTSLEDVQAVLVGWQHRLAGRRFRSSVSLLREDRAR